MHEELNTIAWTADLEIGFESIDQQHQVLVTLYNDLVHALDRNVSVAMKREFLSSVHSYFLAHMAHEEAKLREHKHPKTDEHIGLHREAEAALAEAIRQSGEHLDPFPIAQFLRGRILAHILVEDRSMFKSLAEASEAAE